ncbi:hypothetical protein M2145_000953 [Lachnospiraceae bacterium PF1-21]
MFGLLGSISNKTSGFHTDIGGYLFEPRRRVTPKQILFFH